MNASEVHCEAIYSTLGADPDFGELVEMYVDEIPDRVATLRNAFDSGDRELLQRTAHQIKGASGSYGFPQLTPVAAALEAAVRDGESLALVASALDDLIDLCGRLRAGAAQ